MSAHPGTLVARATALEARVAEFDQSLQGKDQLADLQERHLRLGEIQQRAQEARDCLRRFEARGLRPSLPRGGDDLARAHQALVELKKEFGLDRAVILREDFRNVLLLARSAAASLDERARVVWRELHERQTAAWSPEFLKALEKLEQFRPAVEVIRTSQEKLRQLALRFPPTDADLDQFAEATAERARAFEQLEGQRGIPESVVTFLTQCASSGFPLELVTSEIREWLQAEGILASFRVRL